MKITFLLIILHVNYAFCQHSGTNSLTNKFFFFDTLALNENNCYLLSEKSKSKTNYETIHIICSKKDSNSHELVGDYYLPHNFKLTNDNDIFCTVPGRSIEKNQILRLFKNAVGKWAFQNIEVKLLNPKIQFASNKLLIVNSKSEQLEESELFKLSDKNEYKLIKKKEGLKLSAINNKGIACGENRTNNNIRNPVLYFIDKDTAIFFLSKIPGYATHINDNGTVCGVFYAENGEERGFVWNINQMKTFSEDVAFTDINPDNQTIPMFINNSEIIVGRSKSDFVYIKDMTVFKMKDLLLRYGYVNYKCINILSLNNNNYCLVECIVNDTIKRLVVRID